MGVHVGCSGVTINCNRPTFAAVTILSEILYTLLIFYFCL